MLTIFFFHLKKTNNKKGKQTNKVNNSKLKEKKKDKFPLRSFSLRRYVVTRFTNNDSLTHLIRAERQIKTASPEESGRIVTHENVPFSSNRNYERTSSKLADENAKCPGKCPSCI